MDVPLNSAMDLASNPIISTGDSTMNPVHVTAGPALARYGFGEAHPFGNDRQAAFLEAFRARGLHHRTTLVEPTTAAADVIGRFHTPAYIQRVQERSRDGLGFLDLGDTPAFPGVYEAAATVVGSAVAAAEAILAGRCRRAFIPIGGLHHARRDGAAGFCVFNDCGVVIETLLGPHGLGKVAYVDIDAHHGDGVYYAFEDRPGLVLADIHEDGRYLYPGTGAAHETGRGAGRGNKLNIPVAPDSGDEVFMREWQRVEELLVAERPEFIILQAGADGIAGDPITHLRYTAAVHGHAAGRLAALADEMCEGRLLALGGGGYDRGNLGRAWSAVVEAMVGSQAPA